MPREQGCPATFGRYLATELPGSRIRPCFGVRQVQRSLNQSINFQADACDRKLVSQVVVDSGRSFGVCSCFAVSEFSQKLGDPA